MKLQEFCLKILSFPFLAKLVEWKFHCSQFHRTTSFPLITLLGGTFASTETTTLPTTVTSTLAAPPASSSTLILPVTPTDAVETSESTVSYPDLTTTEFSSPPPETTTEVLTTTTLTIPYTLPITTEESSTALLNEILTTTEENLLIFTIPPPILTTTEFIRSSSFEPSVLSEPNLTTTSDSSSTLAPTKEVLTTRKMTSNIPTYPPPIITTTGTFSSDLTTLYSTLMPTDLPSITTPTPSSEKPSTVIPITIKPPLLTTTLEPQDSSTSFSDSSTSFPNPSVTTLQTSSKSFPLTTQSTILPSTLSQPVTETIIPSFSVTTPSSCPPFPMACPTAVNSSAVNSTNFGDNLIDPRSPHLRQGLLDGCPCIDIRYAIAELLSRTASKAQDCTIDQTRGNCINFRFCNRIVDLIIQNQQKRDEIIEGYIRRSICGYDGADPKVCCPALIFANTGTLATSATPGQPQPGPFVFSSIVTSSWTSTSTQPFSSLQPTPNTSPTSTTQLASNSPVVFSTIPSSTSTQTTFPSTSVPLTTVGSSGALPTYDTDKCGVSSAVRSRIVGGTNAPRGGYPWLAALGYQTPAVRFLCGGSLITQRHVVSAAHCVVDGLAFVRLGAYDITSNTEGAVDVLIETKFIHESYDPKFITNDISMLKLNRNVNYTNLIKPICLPLTDALINRDYTGSTPFVAGWGSTSFRGPGSAILQELQLPIVSTSECEFNYRLYFPNQIFDNKVLCAGYAQGGKDSCQGDSGGGLVLPILSSDGSTYYYILIGIVSYGFECARPNFPGIYTRVPSFIQWIQSKINQ